MTPENAEQLVHETAELIGVDTPALLSNDSPTFRPTEQQEIYFVGLIGGKEVGKSALVNALVAQPITEETSHGPGTQIAIAYVHRNAKSAAESVLQRELPGQFQIVTHDENRLLRQVLLDLPDIDSRFADHLQITRKMLRHMLFPVWIQSVEKYADAQPQNLLAQVAAGNDPKNFLFCLNKSDQLPKDDAQAMEVPKDYARRLAKVLSLPQPPRVFMISAVHSREFDLPELSKFLSLEKSTELVADSRQLASLRRQKSLLSWLDAQDLPGRASRLHRLDEEASELLSERLGEPMVESALPALLDDTAYRLVMTDGVFAKRVSRWPMVNVLHALLSPLRLFARENSNAAGSLFAPQGEALVDVHLGAIKPPIATLIQSTFAQLHQSSPVIASFYSRRKLWEIMEAQAAADRLRMEWIETIRRQRQTVLTKLSGKSGIIAPFFRILLTVGALLWFPIIQPVLHTILTASTPLRSLHDGAIVLVEMLSTAALLKNAVFLLLWFFLLWALLRWDTRRRVERLLTRWRTAKQPDPSLNLTATTLQWIEGLLDPIQTAHKTTERLNQAVQSLRNETAKK
jgi:GTPase Era involved in 16S rRNA processing